jgi:hypothetical protein
VVTPAVPAIVADPSAVPPVLAAAPIPESVSFLNQIKVLDVYSDKLLEIAQKNASLIWGNQSFTDQNPKAIEELTQANGELTTHGGLTASGKKLFSNASFPRF